MSSTLFKKMKPILLYISAFLLTLCAYAENEEEGPLEVTVSEKWQIRYKGDGTQFYTVTRKEGETALLMFHRWPAPGNRDQIPVYLGQIADGFLKEAKNNPDFHLEKEGFVKEKIEGIEFTGEVVIFTIQGGMYQAVFMLSNGDGIWNGQFSGSKERWLEALEILKGLKHKG